MNGYSGVLQKIINTDEGYEPVPARPDEDATPEEHEQWRRETWEPYRDRVQRRMRIKLKVQRAKTVDELARIWRDAGDVWTEQHTELGHQRRVELEGVSA